MSSLSRTIVDIIREQGWSAEDVRLLEPITAEKIRKAPPGPIIGITTDAELTASLLDDGWGTRGTTEGTLVFKDAPSPKKAPAKRTYSARKRR